MKVSAIQTQTSDVVIYSTQGFFRRAQRLEAVFGLRGRQQNDSVLKTGHLYAEPKVVRDSS